MAGYGYGISVSGSRTPVVASSGGEIIPPSGLSLWLKADAGITSSYRTYVSQIILTCTGGLSSYSGTYIATSTPDIDGVYSLLCSANSKVINKEGFESDFTIGPDFALAVSANGISWSLQNVLVVGMTISGSDDADANGVYELNERNAGSADLYNSNGYVILTNTSGVVEVYSPESVLLHSNSSYGSGAWTNEGATGDVEGLSITLNPSGTASGSITTSNYGDPIVEVWADQSGNGNNASANSGQEPTFVSPFSNSKPAIEFNGTSQIMQIADANSLDFLTTSSFIVLKYIGQGTGNNIVYFKNANAGSPADPAMYGLVGANGDNFVSFSVNVGGWSDYDTSISIANAVPKILSMTLNGTSQNVYSNGVISNNFSIVGDIATSTGTLQIGGYNQSFDSEEYFYGQIAEVIMYNRAVTGTERQQIEAYLNTKYEIY
jgi:hypothetical protein